MNPYNPYAAPPPTSPTNAGPGVVAGQPQPWAIGEVWSLAIDRFKDNGLILIPAYFAYMVIGGVPGQLPSRLGAAGILSPGSDLFWGVTSVSSLFSWVCMSFLGVGMNRMALQVARGQTPSFGELFSGGSRFLPFFATNLLLILIAGVTGIFLLVPMFIILTGLFFAQFYVVDAELGPIEALSASWQATSGQKGNLFLCGLVAVAFGLLGVLACCVGIFVAAPVVMVAAAIVYTRISGRGPALAGPPPGGGYGGPPGGYGGPPGGYGGPPGGYGGPPGGGYGGPPGGGYGGPPGGGGYGPPGGGGYGPPGGGGGYGPPGGGGGGYGPPGGGGGGYGPPR